MALPGTSGDGERATGQISTRRLVLEFEDGKQTDENKVGNLFIGARYAFLYYSVRYVLCRFLLSVQ